MNELELYRKLGLNVIPFLPKSKRPAIDWKKYQAEKYLDDFPPDCNLGIVCGITSGNLVVIDLDSPELLDEFREYLDSTLVVKTGKKGYHIYLRILGKLPDILRLTNKKGQHIDVQSSGTCVVAAPSIHPDTSTKYEIISSIQTIQEIDFVKIREKLKKLGFLSDSAKKSLPEIKNGVDEGDRNNSLFRYAILERKKYNPDNAELLHLLEEQNKKNNPPLQDAEVKQIAKSAMSYNLNNSKYLQDKNIYELTSVSEIEDPKYVGKTVQTTTAVSSNTISYSIPSIIKGECTTDHDCIASAVYEIQDYEKPVFAELSESRRYKKCEELLKRHCSFMKECKILATEQESVTLTKFRVRPIVNSLVKDNGKFFDNKENEWKAYDIYLEQRSPQSFEAGKEIVITGTVIPDPKNQRITMIASDVLVNETNRYSIDNTQKLKEMFGLMDENQISDWLMEEFEKYSRIIKRGNITLAGFLTFFSILNFEFEGKDIPGWVKSLIIGDSTTGKSETIKQQIMLLMSGLIISGETASVAGIGATATQSANNQWFLDYGPLVLQDRKLLAIDGAHKMSREQWSTLAESERDGRLRITKAAKGEAYARTRLIKIMNPLGDDLRTTNTMQSLFLPCQSIQNNLQVQSIARVDLAVFVSDDVNSADRNKRINQRYDKRLEYLADLLRLVWEQKFEVILDEDTYDEILIKATELEKKFKFVEIPLVTNDQKYKIAKIATSFAALTCSFNDDFSKLLVKKEHVTFVAKFIDEEYHDAGLHILASQERTEEITEEDIHDLFFKIRQSMDKREPPPDDDFCTQLLLWIGQKTQFTKDQLSQKFSLSRDNEQRPLVTVLKNEEIIEQKRGFRSAKKGINVAKFLKNKGDSLLA